MTDVRYIGPDRPYLFIKDETLYKAMYCGVCRCISKECGQMARTALTYDIAFMSALLHNIRGEDVKIVKRRCPVHPIKRRPMTEADELTRTLACVNTALAWYKLTDDNRMAMRAARSGSCIRRATRRCLQSIRR